MKTRNMNNQTGLQLKEYLARSPEWLKKAYYHNATINHTMEWSAAGGLSYEDMKWKLLEILMHEQERLIAEKIERMRNSPSLHVRP